jgi:putative nucleotidyltransferase with HDIG domain
MTNSLADVLKEIDGIPVPNFVVTKVLELVNKPDVSALDLTELIEKDPNLTVRIMKLANSSYYGLPQKITNLSHAIMILGFKTLRNLVVSVYTHDAFFSSKLETKNITEDELWWHLVATAIATEHVSTSVGYINKEEAFLAGMLHDLGKIVMAKLFPNYVDALIILASKKSITYVEAEKKMEFPDHVFIGKYLLEKWKFPQIIQIPVAFHHDPGSVTEESFRDITYVVHSSDIISSILNQKAAGNYTLPIVKKEVWNYLKLNGTSFLDMIRSTRDSMKKSDTFFKI